MANTDPHTASGWSWCEDCQSYHHPRNLTCRKLWPKEYTLMTNGHGMFLAESHWHSPRDGQQGPMRAAWKLVDLEFLQHLRNCGIDTGGPWHAGGYMMIDQQHIPLDWRILCMRGMIQAKGYWADGSKKGPGDPGQDWRRALVDKAG